MDSIGEDTSRIKCNCTLIYLIVLSVALDYQNLSCMGSTYTESTVNHGTFYPRIEGLLTGAILIL